MADNREMWQSLGMDLETHDQLCADGVSVFPEGTKRILITGTPMAIPYMKLETDYSQSDAGQLETRIAAFIEML